METINKHKKRKRGRFKECGVSTRTPPVLGLYFPAKTAGKAEEETKVREARRTTSTHEQSMSDLHVACLYGELAGVRLLLESRRGSVHSCDSQGRRPLHMVLSSRSSPNTAACLSYLLENGAPVNVTTDSGQTALHLAASEGFLDCVEILVKAGADLLSKDKMGLTPLDMTRIWGHRKVARYLKSCMWQAEKKKEMGERKLVQTLYRDLVGLVKQKNLDKKTVNNEKIAEWANKKGLPLLKDLSPKAQVCQYHTQCFSSHNPKQTKAPGKHQTETHQKERSTLTQPTSRPWTVFMGLQPEKPLIEPDLRDRVAVWKDNSKPQYNTRWDETPRPTPNLPLDILQRVLFPRAFPSRIASIQQFQPKDIEGVQHRGFPPGRSTSPWTEVAMHLPEVLEPGHY